MNLFNLKLRAILSFKSLNFTPDNFISVSKNQSFKENINLKTKNPLQSWK